MAIWWQSNYKGIFNNFLNNALFILNLKCPPPCMKPIFVRMNFLPLANTFKSLMQQSWWALGYHRSVTSAIIDDTKLKDKFDRKWPKFGLDILQDVQMVSISSPQIAWMNACGPINGCVHWIHLFNFSLETHWTDFPHVCMTLNGLESAAVVKILMSLYKHRDTRVSTRVFSCLRAWRKSGAGNFPKRFGLISIHSVMFRKVK